MKNGYKILWTQHALNELQITFEYLEKNWSKKSMKNLAKEIEKVVELIASNPEIFPSTEISEKIRRAVISKHNTLFYRINKSNVEILSFFFNKRNPENLNL